MFQFRKFWFFIRKSIKYFWSWKVTSWNIRKFHFLKYKGFFFEVPVFKKLGAFLRKHKKLFWSRLFRKNFKGWDQKVRGSIWENINKNFLLRKYKKFFNLRIRKFYFPKYKDVLFGVDYFYFFGLGLKGSIYRNIKSFFRVSVHWNIKNFFRSFRFLNFFNIRAKKFHFQIYKDFFSVGGWKVRGPFLRKYKKIFNLRVRKCHFPKYKKFLSGQIFFFIIFEEVWAEKCAR